MVAGCILYIVTEPGLLTAQVYEKIEKFTFLFQSKRRDVLRTAQLSKILPKGRFFDLREMYDTIKLSTSNNQSSISYRN